GDIISSTTVANAAGVTLDAGGGGGSYAQIGAGGNFQGGNLTGATTVLGTGNITMLSQGGRGYTHIGLGGVSNVAELGNMDGAVNVSGANIRLQGGNSFNSYSMIGNGGVNTTGTMDGDVNVTATGTLDAIASTHGNGFAKIGHGGVNSDGDMDGDVTILAGGAVTMNARGQASQSNSFVQFGHGGSGSAGNHTGDVKLKTTSGDITMSGGVGGNTFVQIGNGGNGSGGNHGGLVSVRTETGGISMTGDAGDRSYTQIGHGGNTARGDLSGRIEVLAVNDIAIQGGAGVRSYGQIGHGGFDADLGDQTTAGSNGNITIASTTGGLSMIGGTSATANEAGYVQVGHGGALNRGQNTGNIIGRFGGDATIQAGTGHSAYAQFGHGGEGASADAGHKGSIVLTSGTLQETIIADAANNGAQDVGTVASRDFDDVFDVNEDGVIDNLDVVTITNGTTNGVRVGAATAGGVTGIEAYSMIGHGGYNANGDHGDIAVGQPENHSIDIETSGGLSLFGGNSNVSAAQIGHGGQGANGDMGSRIIIAAENNIILQGGTGNASYAQIGLGGNDASANTPDGNKSGKIITYSRSGNITIQGGTTNGAYAQVGHGGRNHDGDFDHEGFGVFVWTDNGDVTVNRGGANDEAYGMIGSGDGLVAGTGNRSDQVFVGSGNGNLIQNAGIVGHRTAGGGSI
ncbi:hypothetical protein OAL00_07715, partial [Verrucomicrobiales bacterium]|nr:hypothetical protein [Verrucomicrobiales bacterium]